MGGRVSDLIATIKVVEKYLELGFKPPSIACGRGESSAISEASKELKLNSQSVRSRLATAENQGLRPDWTKYRVAINDQSNSSAATPEGRAEIRNTEYWRRKSAALEKELRTVEHALEEVSGLRTLPIQPPKWLMPSSSKKARRSAICLLVSDVHAGEVVYQDEMLGINAFDVEICRKRLRRLFSATCEIGARWSSDTSNQGAVLFLSGDLISGDIHEELRITNALTSHEQVRFMVEECSAGIEKLKAAFGHVHVTSVPGNHGRTTMKPTAKLYSRLSYDTVVSTMISDQYKRDKNVSFQIGTSRDQIVNVLGFPFLQTHGDSMGSGGGMGFIGPMAPIVRGSKKVEAQQSRAGRSPYWILHGHFHTSGQPGNVFSNGSVPGYSEYAYGLRASLEPPQQWAWMVHETWGVRDRLEVKLDDAVVAPLAPSQMPSFMSARAA